MAAAAGVRQHTTRWEMPPPESSNYGRKLEGRHYGIMALVRDERMDTLGELRELTGIAESQLKDRRGRTSSVRRFTGFIAGREAAQN